MYGFGSGFDEEQMQSMTKRRTTSTMNEIVIPSSRPATPPMLPIT